MSWQGGGAGMIDIYQRTDNEREWPSGGTGGGGKGESFTELGPSDPSSVQLFVTEGEVFYLKPGESKTLVKFVMDTNNGDKGKECSYIAEVKSGSLDHDP